ncbi:MAG TPA: hypothetical protein VMV95_02090 [Bacillota bacterium]|nr:hypothetical protein [Bacillota bacterium]
MADRVKINMGKTINIGNFESIRIDAGYETDVEENFSVSNAFTKAKKIVQTQINNMEQEIKT